MAMKVECTLSQKRNRWLAFPIFITLIVVFRVPWASASLAALLLPAVRIEFSMGWCLAMGVAAAAWVLNEMGKNRIVLMIAKGLHDFVYSRMLRMQYKLVGHLTNLADEGHALKKPLRPGPREVFVVRTSKFRNERLAVIAPMFLGNTVPPSGEATLILDTTMRYQTFAGFGGAFTESSADLLLQVSPKNQELILNAYFNADTGLNYRIGRLHMNSCDFSKGNWSCAEQPGDKDLKSFTIERYKATMIPMLKRAEAAAGEPLTLFASPWSPPAWMKDIQRMTSGGKLLPNWRSTWAKFYVRFAQELLAEGVKLWGFTVQNEPLAATPWENCLYTHEEERDFVRDFLGPALNASGMDLKLMVWDHNRDDMFARSKAIYDDPEAAKYVWGVGYHWYGDPKFEVWPALEGMVLHDNLQRVHDLRPDTHIWMTEACQEFGPRIGDWGLGERYGEALIKDFNRWLEAWVDWNLILDADGGPNHVSNLVSAPIIADIAQDKVWFLSNFYYIGHFSRYIKPGAVRIGAVPSRDAIEAVGFLNPDGTIAVVVMNQRDLPYEFWLQFNRQSSKVTVPEHSIMTFVLLDQEPEPR